MKTFHLHLVSDSTGETVSSVSRSALIQFADVAPTEHLWSLVRTKGQLEKMITALDTYPGVVMFTLVDKDMREMLREACAKRNLPCIPVIGHVIRALSEYLDEEARNKPGRLHDFSEDYYRRVEAIDFTLAHDDGQAYHNLEKADIVLVGVSRTSKSPTCVYLANRGYKVANVPFVINCPLPDNLFTLQNPLVVGLTINLERLLQIRKSRLESINENKHTSYIDQEEVQKEIDAARKLFRQQRWPTIDVTRRSVEETSALIIQYRQNQQRRRQEEKNHA